jgi:hypothetical protein
MWRAIKFLIAGLYCSALLTSVLSVYVLHDLDSGLNGNQAAFSALSGESVFFALFVGGLAALFFWLGRAFFRLVGIAPGAKFAFVSGVVVGIGQYPGDYLTRRLAPAFIDKYLSTYLLLGPLLCAALLIYDCRKKKIEIANTPVA